MEQNENNEQKEKKVSKGLAIGSVLGGVGSLAGLALSATSIAIILTAVKDRSENFEALAELRDTYDYCIPLLEKDYQPIYRTEMGVLNSLDPAEKNKIEEECRQIEETDEVLDRQMEKINKSKFNVPEMLKYRETRKERNEQIKDLAKKLRKLDKKKKTKPTPASMQVRSR